MTGTYKVNKTIQEINNRIKEGKAAVVNAEEMVEIVRAEGKVNAAKAIDVVTTGTFSPMCSSGIFFNFGQVPPPIKASRVWLNNVPCYAGLAGVDAYIGVTEPSEDDPLNKVYPGRFAYGGGHVVEDLIAGKSVRLRAQAYGTDCYPRKAIEKDITLKDLFNVTMVNPRNCYQNYNCAVNMTSRTIYTYMGPLKPNLRNANFATAGQLSPLFNDPFLKTIGVGTRIFIAGAEGYVTGAGTQHVEKPQRNERGIPLTPAGTLMLQSGNVSDMDPRYFRGLSFTGYGCTASVGVGIPIPILNEEIAWCTGISDAEIQMPVKDYGHDYPNGINKVLAHVTFEELKSGSISINGEKIPTVPMTSHVISLEIANKLKDWITKGEFLLTEPVEKIESE
ncbi:homocysteine biosynthesis protein [Maridesulfovibrio sp.]|uniref:homocysteine biosynthesis protein n=1 Tax=Maridesulfovibrio sp. TaxID=2795000 RepID=UPI0029C9D195|nr:homocysteine biosynthesis protein [Maridesulfovibrio sp.]